MTENQNSNTIKYFINKLVRDEIKNITEKDINLTLKQVPQIKYIILRKLIEELEELQNEIFHNLFKKYNILDEIVDVFEVLLKIIQIWHIKYKSYSLNEIASVVLQYNVEITETKPLLLVRKMYSLAIDLLKMQNATSEERMQHIDLLCNYFSVLLNKLKIKYSILIAARIGKQKYRGIFNRNYILTHIEMPVNHRLIYLYNKYKVIK